MNKTVRDFQKSSRFNDSDVAKVMILITDGKLVYEWNENEDEKFLKMNKP